MYLNQEYKNRFRILKGGLISLVVASNLYGAPTGGIVTSGNANISQNGNTTNINQSSQKATINWQSFGIKNGETVNFNQPNSNSITLNRVIGNEKSIIDGALNANGQVWILNSNGTLFGKNAKVNTSGLLVTTKNISDDDFQKGNYSFRGDSKASIENLGNISSEKYSSFIANSVVNNGTIKVHSGTINLTGASEFSISLDENSNISLKVTKGVLDALVENNNLLIANGGNVYLTTNAKNELLKGVVNNSGIIEANSLDDITGKQSEVIIFAHGGTANIDGEIKAKNSFVETSGENLNVSANTKVIAKTWLLDPVNMTIESTGGNSLTGASVSAIAIQNALGGTNVELQADNNITVNQNITWSTDKQLKLSADNINVNATINNINKTNGGVYFNAANNQSKVVFGADGKVIVNNVYQLQWINTALGGKYELGSNIDAGVTSSWNSNKGFNPIGDFSTSDNNSMFTGTFDGKGFTISDLYISRSGTAYVGLFGFANSATIRNIGLVDVNITGYDYVGGLIGINSGTIQNSYATGSVIGHNVTGGLTGYNIHGTIQNSYAKGTINGNDTIGGLVGQNQNGTIENSYASETVTRLSGTNTDFGGLLGANRDGTIQNSWYDNETNTNSLMGDSSSYGKTKAEIKSLIIGSSGEWETDLSKGRGYGLGGTTDLPFLKNVTKLSNSLFEDGLGTALNPYTITNWTQLQNINNNDTVFRSGKFFNLINNLDSSTTGYTTQASSTANGFQGWNPIGWNSGNRFKGTFDGLGFTISDLKISRSGTDYVGLFGYTDNATTTIKNLGLVDVAITGNNYVGGLVGRNENHSQIENSYVTGNVSGNWYVGGLVGVNSQGTIKNSYASGNVSGNYSVGGLVGFNYSSQIENSYASATVTRLSGTDTEFGGLVGYNNNSQIINSFYDKTKNPNFDNGLGTGKTTQELSYGGTFKTAPTPWNIRADSSVNQTTPVLKYDSDERTSYWAIAPIALNYNLRTKSTTYNGNVQNLGDFYTSNPFIIPTGYEFLGNIAYKFQKDGSDISGYKNAGTYSDIKLVSNNEFLSIATTGNTNGTLTINKKDLTIDNVTANNKTYDGNNTAILSNKGNLVGLVNNETLELNYATSEFSDKNAETGKTVTVTGYQIADKNGNLASNYNLTQTSKTTTANISKANLTIDNVTANNKTYDANNIATLSNKGNLVGLVNNETLELNYATSEFNNKNAGTGKTVTVNEYEIADKDGNLASNYNLTQTSKTTTANISKKDISNVSYTAENKTYDGNSSAIVSGSSSDFITNDKVGFTQTANFDNKNAGTGKDVNISDIVLSGVDAQNYNLTQTSKTTTADISKKDLTITANSMSKVYNGQIQSLSGYSVIGLVGGDKISDLAGISGDSVSGIKVGEYNTNLSGSDNNYNLTFVNGKLTITSKPIEPNKVVQNSEVQKVINSIQKSIQMTNSTQSLSNILSSVNNSTVDTQIQEQQNSNLLNTNQNIKTLTLGKNLEISIVNGGVNAPSVNIEEIKNLLSTQN